MSSALEVQVGPLKKSSISWITSPYFMTCPQTCKCTHHERNLLAGLLSSYFFGIPQILLLGFLLSEIEFRAIRALLGGQDVHQSKEGVAARCVSNLPMPKFFFECLLCIGIGANGIMKTSRVVVLEGLTLKKTLVL